ncbi:MULTISPECIES: hypothetical protein [unclassified Janibacter]|uniref:hypothetical protein n=1 Tax=unclassified Janibacter TaxID=2649294 RepID=UPI003D078A46
MSRSGLSRSLLAVASGALVIGGQVALATSSSAAEAPVANDDIPYEAPIHTYRQTSSGLTGGITTCGLTAGDFVPFGKGWGSDELANDVVAAGATSTFSVEQSLTYGHLETITSPTAATQWRYVYDGGAPDNAVERITYTVTDVNGSDSGQVLYTLNTKPCGAFVSSTLTELAKGSATVTIGVPGTVTNLYGSAILPEWSTLKQPYGSSTSTGSAITFTVKPGIDRSRDRYQTLVYSYVDASGATATAATQFLIPKQAGGAGKL